MSATWPVPPDEEERLAVLRSLDVLDTPREERFDRIARTAQRLLGVPIALVSLMDADRQWFKSCMGLEGSEVGRGVSFCSRVIATGTPVVIEDASADPRFADHPLVAGEPHVRFYAGWPLRAPSGHAVGTLCAIDRRPRTLTPEDHREAEGLVAWADLELATVITSRTTKELERLRRQQASVLRSAAEGIVAVDCDGVVQLANPAAERIAGRPLLGLPVGEVLDGRRQGARPEPGRSVVERVLDTGEAEAVEGAALQRPDGTTLLVGCTVAPLLEDGSTSGAVVVLEDITGRLEVERLKDEFVAVVSHELRTPLTSIRGSLGLLAAGLVGELSGEAQEMVQVASDSTDRLVRLVNDVLDLQRLTSGRAHLELAATALADVAAVAARSVAGAARAAEAAVELAVPADLVVPGDADRLVQVLTNLLGNALKFSPRGSRVEVRAHVEGEDAVLEVVDQGRGIPADKLATIFDRFEQAEASDARTQGGTGLGLTISRAIVDAHGGRISVRSEVGRGSTFSVRLPLGAPA